jgi:choline dehydrogenase-like flavoprotein
MDAPMKANPTPKSHHGHDYKVQPYVSQPGTDLRLAFNPGHSTSLQLECFDRDSINIMTAHKDIPSSADYIIIGGGLAGCVLASRLNQYLPTVSILLIEAGPDPTGHPFVTDPLSCFAAHHSDIDWNYTSVPQKHLDDRTTYAAAGKVLSGGTATNYGTWTRGPKADYDLWAKVVGDKAWSYEGLLPYFKRTETHFGKPDDAGKEQHGFEGPIWNVSISASSEKRKYPLRDKVRSAWERLGVQYTADANAGNPLGLAEVAENWREGKRQLACKAYDLSGVYVVTDTLVQKVVVEDRDGEKVATGVQLADGQVLKAGNEVIVSAGAYRTPQVLMLSGIGPAAELAKFDIQMQLDSPYVGQNIFDHLHCFMFWKLRRPEDGLALGTPLWKDPTYFMGIPCDWIVSEHVPDAEMKVALKVDGDEKDCLELLDPNRCHTENIVCYTPGGFSFAKMDVPMDGTYMSALVVGMTPTSRGSITISSTNPADSPIIDPNFYATEADRTAMRAGFRQLLRLFQDTPEGREMVESELAPEGYRTLNSKSTDEEIDKRIRRVGNTLFHPAGSASMGKVVDTELRVKGIQGLRVVDASVLPISICAHYQVPVYAIAEKAAEMIAARSLWKEK